MTEGEMVGWHHQLNGHEFEQTLGDREGRGAWWATVYGVTQSRTRLSDLAAAALNIKWPKYRSFSVSISPSNEYSGLISFRVDWFDLLGDQETLKSLLQHHNLKASVLQCSASLWSNSHIHI